MRLVTCEVWDAHSTTRLHGAQDGNASWRRELSAVVFTSTRGADAVALLEHNGASRLGLAISPGGPRGGPPLSAAATEPAEHTVLAYLRV